MWNIGLGWNMARSVLENENPKIPMFLLGSRDHAFHCSSSGSTPYILFYCSFWKLAMYTLYIQWSKFLRVRSWRPVGAMTDSMSLTSLENKQLFIWVQKRFSIFHCPLSRSQDKQPLQHWMLQTITLHWWKTRPQTSVSPSHFACLTSNPKNPTPDETFRHYSMF